MEIKRVVTAVDAEGRSIVQEDAPLQPRTARLMPGTSIWMVWGSEGPVPAPREHPVPDDQPTFFPGPGGTRFGIFSFPPGKKRDAPPRPAPPAEVMEKLVAEAEVVFPGLVAQFDLENPGVHATPTVDYDIVIQGTLTLELDDGVEVELPTGSCVVQNGTRHAWHNYGDEEAMLAYVIVDSRGRGTD